MLIFGFWCLLLPLPCLSFCVVYDLFSHHLSFVIPFVASINCHFLLSWVVASILFIIIHLSYVFLVAIIKCSSSFIYTRSVQYGHMGGWDWALYYYMINYWSLHLYVTNFWQHISLSINPVAIVFADGHILWAHIWLIHHLLVHIAFTLIAWSFWTICSDGKSWLGGWNHSLCLESPSLCNIKQYTSHTMPIKDAHFIHFFKIVQNYALNILETL